MRRQAGRVLSILALIAVCCFLTPARLHPGGGKKSGEEEKITFWHSITSENKDILNSLIDEFNREVSVLPVSGGFQGGEEDLLIKLISQETMPDLALIPVYFLQSLHDRGHVQPLESLIPESLRQDISDKFWNSVTIGGSIVGVPFQFSTHLFYVNQHILRISGNRRVLSAEDWDNILRVSDRIKANTDEAWGLFIPMENLIHFTAFVESFTGVSPFDDEGSLRVDREDIVRAMTYLQDLVYERRIMPPRVTRSEAEQIFLSGRLGLMMAPSARMVYTQSNLPYNMNVWRLPHPQDTKPIIVGSCLTVLTDDPYRRERVMDFVEHLTSYESIIRWHTHTGAPAIRTSVKDSIDLLIFYEENPNYTTSVIELERGRVFNPSIDYLTANDVVKEFLAEILLKRRDPAEALGGAQVTLDGM